MYPIHRPTSRLKLAIVEIVWWLVCALLIMVAAVLGQRIDDYGEDSESDAEADQRAETFPPPQSWFDEDDE